MEPAISTDPVFDASGHHTDRAIRARIIEFLGGRDLVTASCVHLTACDCANPAHMERRPVIDLDRMLDNGEAIARSLYDSRSYLVHLDIEYVNHDMPEAAFTDPWRAFRLQEPVIERVEQLLSGWGIRPLHLLTGQGHHFVWRFPRDGDLERRIRHLLPSAERYGGEQTFANLGLLMEYFAHRIKEVSEAAMEIPVEITASQVLAQKSGHRELVSIDISEYGDPLGSRSIRVPFTRYLKPWSSGIASRMGLEGQIGPCLCIPLHEIEVMHALQLRQEPAAVLALAKRCCMLIPDEAEGTGHLLDDYLGSTLRAFHQRYYKAEHDPPETWPHTYGRTPLDDLPESVRHVLLHPNDLLMKPSAIRLVTRCLLHKGWHPRHIAGLVRSKFEDPVHDWGDRWAGYSPAYRADFYVRLFAGLISTGLDRVSDLHCDAAVVEGTIAPVEHAETSRTADAPT